jgi:hypothetical protein
MSRFGWVLTEATLEAQTLLWESASQACEEDDPEQRAWKIRYAEGVVDACEHAGLLSADQVVEWRRLLARGGAPPSAPGDRDAAERHLEELLAAVPPLSREPETTAFAAGRRFDAALAALHESGVLSDEVARGWRARGLAAEAPWLAQDEISELLGSGEGADAIAIAIPGPPEEEAAAAEATREIEMVARRGPAKRVFVPNRPQRQDGLAIAAVVTRTEATEVVFHHVGDPQGDVGSERVAMAAFPKTDDALVPPSLADDKGTVYRPVRDHPLSSHGSAGPERPPVTTGVWRYQPPAPDSAAAFEVTTPGARWRLTPRNA